MEEKKYFLMYKDWENAIGLLSTEQKGLLLEAIYAYQCGKESDIKDKMVEMAFNGFILPSFRRVEEKYEVLRQLKSECGKKGGRPRKADETEEKQKKQQLSEKSRKSSSFSENHQLLDESKKSYNNSNIKNKNNNRKNNINEEYYEEKDIEKETEKEKVEVPYPQFDFSIAKPEYVPLLIKWLDYKKGRKQKYKTQKSFEQLYKRMEQIGSPEEANDAIEYSMANNYSGLFIDKDRNANGIHQQRQELEREQRGNDAASIMQGLIEERNRAGD